MQLGHFAHVLLFTCPQCGSPVASARLIEEKNLETADAVEYMLLCRCGWMGQIVGARALKRWVEQWDSRASSACVQK